MKEQLVAHKFSGNVAHNNSLNPALITMQIQALRESLQRLVEQENVVEVDEIGREKQEIQSKLNY
jgi:hypothetical protein